MVGSFLMLAIYQVLVTHSRVYAGSSAQIRGKEMFRSRMDLFLGELRELSPRGGDLVEMRKGSMTIRSQREFGLVCDADDQGSLPRITVFSVGSWFEVGDSILVFSGSEENAGGDVWLNVEVQTVDTAALCPGGPAQTLGIGGLDWGENLVRIGAPVRAFETFTYGLYETDGGWYLGRKAQGAKDALPLVGPLLGPDGVTFRYLDRWGEETSTDTLVAQIEVTLRPGSPPGAVPGALISDSVVARVFPRN